GGDTGCRLVSRGPGPGGGGRRQTPLLGLPRHHPGGVLARVRDDVVGGVRDDHGLLCRRHRSGRFPTGAAYGRGRGRDRFPLARTSSPHAQCPVTARGGGRRLRGGGQGLVRPAVGAPTERVGRGHCFRGSGSPRPGPSPDRGRPTWASSVASTGCARSWTGRLSRWAGTMSSSGPWTKAGTRRW